MFSAFREEPQTFWRESDSDKEDANLGKAGDGRHSFEMISNYLASSLAKKGDAVKVEHGARSSFGMSKRFSTAERESPDCCTYHPKITLIKPRVSLVGIDPIQKRLKRRHRRIILE